MKEGFVPDSISTDLHIGSMNAGMKDMTNVMSKFLALGQPLAEVVRWSTWNPAREIKQEGLGHLSVGAGADVAVLRLEGQRNLPTASLGDSDSARVGQWVLAIGSPFGLNQTVTHGILSARERGQVSLGNTIRIKLIDTHNSKRGWEFFRTAAREMLWPKIDAEYQEELKGIVEGVKARGVSLGIDDVVALNAACPLHRPQPLVARLLTVVSKVLNVSSRSAGRF